LPEVTLSDILLGDEENFQDPSFLALDAQDGVVRSRALLGSCGDGARTLVATNKGNRWFFVFGFEKNERTNVSAKELEALQKIAADLLKLTSKDLDAHVEWGEIREISHDDKG